MCKVIYAFLLLLLGLEILAYLETRSTFIEMSPRFFFV